MFGYMAFRRGRRAPANCLACCFITGIITNRQLRHTQVDIAPTILGLAGIATPVTMDGRSIVALLVTKPAEAPASVQHHLTAQEPGPAPVRAYSFHEYYNQVQWLRHQSWPTPLACCDCAVTVL